MRVELAHWRFRTNFFCILYDVTKNVSFLQFFLYLCYKSLLRPKFQDFFHFFLSFCSRDNRADFNEICSINGCTFECVGLEVWFFTAPRDRRPEYLTSFTRKKGFWPTEGQQSDPTRIRFFSFWSTEPLKNIKYKIS